MLHETLANQPAIISERFVLRPLRKSDAGLIGFYAGEERLARMTRDIPHPLPVGAIEAYIRRGMSDTRVEDVWVFDGSSFGHAEVMGLISLERMDRAQSEVRGWIAPAFWSTGVASEGIATLLNANPHQADRYFAEVFQDNPGSARVLTNCGFEYLGDAEAFSVARNSIVPTWTYTRKT